MSRTRCSRKATDSPGSAPGPKPSPTSPAQQLFAASGDTRNALAQDLEELDFR